MIAKKMTNINMNIKIIVPENVQKIQKHMKHKNYV